MKSELSEGSNSYRSINKGKRKELVNLLHRQGSKNDDDLSEKIKIPLKLIIFTKNSLSMNHFLYTMKFLKY